MSDTPKKNVIRETDHEALALTNKLVRHAQFGALAAFDAQSAFPHISRIQLSTDADGNLITLISTLSAHTKCLVANPNCAVMVGEPGKGDPLAHPRISISAMATAVARESDQYTQLRKSHLAHYPKAELYIDFGDFSFFKLDAHSAALNGGFGKAFNLSKEEYYSAMQLENDNA